MNVKVEVEGTPSSNNDGVPHSAENNDGIEKLYNIYNQNKNNELERFWKNSMFVWTFIALCFTAYGTIIINFKDINSDIFENCSSYFLLFTSIFGLSLSIIWFWMAKALKTRFKVNEVPVWKMENIDNVFDINDKNLFAFNSNWSENQPFSPSKLVLLVGHLLIIFWSIIALYSISTFDCILKLVKGHCTITCVVLIIFIVIPFIYTYWRRIQGFFNSSSIRNKEEQEAFLKVKKHLITNSALRYFEVKDNTVIFFYTNTNVDSEKDKIEQLFDTQFDDYEEMDYARYFTYKKIDDIKLKNYDRTQNKPTHSA